MAHFGRVYIAQFGNRIKIGYSEYVEGRMKQHRTTTGKRGRLLAVIDCSGDVIQPLKRERQIQAKFAAFSLGHEWFEADKSIIQWAKEMK